MGTSTQHETRTRHELQDIEKMHVQILAIIHAWLLHTSLTVTALDVD